MFARFVYDAINGDYCNRVLIVDKDGICQKTECLRVFAEEGFDVVWYKDDLDFRINHEPKLTGGCTHMVVVKSCDAYVPYDIINYFADVVEFSWETIFPKLNADVLKGASRTDLDLLAGVIGCVYNSYITCEQTERFIRDIAYGEENVEKYVQRKIAELKMRVRGAVSYETWFDVAEEKARLDVLALRHHAKVMSDDLNIAFQNWVMVNFGKLFMEVNLKSPVLVSRAMEFMRERSEKFVVIVMDGMSEFDWHILSESFNEIPYTKTNLFAMIPSTTSVSRQCLLSNKLPNELVIPWNLKNERNEFTACAIALGYAERQIGCARGYEAEFSPFVKCGAIIINDIDDIVHGQKQGRMGMLNDDSVMAKEGRLVQLVIRLCNSGFDVYVTADHGNTQCVGLGRFIGTGLEIETKGHRMAVLKDFADKENVIEKFRLIEYPKFYLPKDLDYLMCNGATSLDVAESQVMTHGGMTLDEVVVPFVMIKAV